MYNRIFNYISTILNRGSVSGSHYISTKEAYTEHQEKLDIAKEQREEEDYLHFLEDTKWR